MKKIIFITLAVFAVGYAVYSLYEPDYATVNRQMVEQCNQYEGVCD